VETVTFLIYAIYKGRWRDGEAVLMVVWRGGGVQGMRRDCIA
jgi:hypothetical protein